MKRKQLWSILVVVSLLATAAVAPLGAAQTERREVLAPFAAPRQADHRFAQRFCVEPVDVLDGAACWAIDLDAVLLVLLCERTLVRRIARALSHFVPQLAHSKTFETARADAALRYRPPPPRSYWTNMLRALAAWRPEAEAPSRVRSVA